MFSKRMDESDRQSLNLTITVAACEREGKTVSEISCSDTRKRE